MNPRCKAAPAQETTASAQYNAAKTSCFKHLLTLALRARVQARRGLARCNRTFVSKTAVETHPDSRPSIQRLGSLSLCRSDRILNRRRRPVSIRLVTQGNSSSSRRGQATVSSLVSKTAADAASNQCVRARACGARNSRRVGSQANFPDSAGVVEFLTSTRSIIGSVMRAARCAAAVVITF